MFEALNERLTGVFDRISGRGALSEADIDAALREVRIALLEADVALPVVKDFIALARERARGEEVIRAVKPADQVIKIVHDGLIEMLGGEEPVALNLNAAPPAVIMMAGLQGSGKTTTSAKLALRLTRHDRRKVMMASLDTRRPAAMEQLETLGRQIEVATLPIVKGESAVEITRRALQAARLQGFDVLILDTAGRTTLDEAMMAEAAEVADIARPVETLLVADSLTGQDAVRTATAFHERLPLTGLVLTRADGDGRGGAMLSMRAVTGLPIKYLGAGEKVDQLDVFDARRVAGRILGQGDIVALVEKASEELDQARAETMARKLAKGQFDLDDLAAQLQQMRRMGGLQGIMGLLPGVAKLKNQMADANIDDRMIARQEAILSSMTRKERKKPDLLNASRKRRIAAGAGVEVSEINRLLKQHRQMADTVKALSRGGNKNLARMAQMMGGQMPGGMPAGADLARLKAMGGGKLPQSLPDGLPASLPGLPGADGQTPRLPGGLPGLPRKK
ncbi:MAG: signal recognition particle protein [Brevundimonas sp.]|jgi:signal recognition particle subunit SRP54|uniref:signal recognition particle protein n=1 Tax=Brevundimonas sp. TaxID=1871086 RepID=UPI003918F400